MPSPPPPRTLSSAVPVDTTSGRPPVLLHRNVQSPHSEILLNFFKDIYKAKPYRIFVAFYFPQESRHPFGGKAGVRGCHKVKRDLMLLVGRVPSAHSWEVDATQVRLFTWRLEVGIKPPRSVQDTECAVRLRVLVQCFAKQGYGIWNIPAKSLASSKNVGSPMLAMEKAYPWRTHWAL